MPERLWSGISIKFGARYQHRYCFSVGVQVVMAERPASFQIIPALVISAGYQLVIDFLCGFTILSTNETIA